MSSEAATETPPVVPTKPKRQMWKVVLVAIVVVVVVVGVMSYWWFSRPPQTTWEKTFGDFDKDVGYSMVQTGDGGYAIAGGTESVVGAGIGDVYLVKTDANLNLMWQQTYGGAGSGYDWGCSVVQVSDGGYAIAGYTNAPDVGSWDGSWNVLLVKTDASGNLLWQKTYGGTDTDGGISVIQTNDGGYAIVGYTSSFGAGHEDVFLVKADSVGTMLWNRTYGGTGEDSGYSLVQTNDGGYAIAGRTNSSGAGSYDVLLVKTDAGGNQLWNRTYGGTGDDYGYSVAQTSDGEYAIAGYTNSSGAGSDDVYLVRTDANGNLSWQKTYGGTGNDRGCSLVQTTDEGYAIVGATRSFGVGSWDVFLVKTDAGGNQLWQKTYGGTEFDEGLSVIQTGDGGYAVAGRRYIGEGRDYDLYLIKTDDEGELGSNG